MKTTIWLKKPMVIYMGGDPTKNQTPEFTIEIQNPQIQLDTDKNTVVIIETK
jgi:hypothetical protein